MLSFHWHQIKFNEKRGENGCVCLYLYSAYNSIEERWSYICENLYIRRIAFNVKQQTVNQTTEDEQPLLMMNWDTLDSSLMLLISEFEMAAKNCCPRRHWTVKSE